MTLPPLIPRTLDGQGWPGELGIYDDHLVPGLARLAATLTGHGALPIAQLFHGGARAPSSLTGKQPWTASALGDPDQGFEPARAATEEDIRAVIGRFVPPPCARARQASPAWSCTARTATCSASSSARR